jgi:hypothetical protein
LSVLAFPLAPSRLRAHPLTTGASDHWALGSSSSGTTPERWCFQPEPSSRFFAPPRHCVLPLKNRPRTERGPKPGAILVRSPEGSGPCVPGVPRGMHCRVG